MINNLMTELKISKFFKRFSVQETRILFERGSPKASSSWISPTDSIFYLQSFSKSTTLSANVVKTESYRNFERTLVLKSLIEKYGLKKRNVSSDEVEGFSYTLM